MKDKIIIAAKLYKSQESAKFLHGKDYEEKIKWYKEQLQEISQEKGITILEAVIIACEVPVIQSSGTAIMMFLAAAVEIIEPTKSAG